MNTKLLVLIFIVCASSFAFLISETSKKSEVRENDESRCTRRLPSQPWTCEPKKQATSKASDL